MQPIKKIIYAKDLPESFFEIPKSIYAGLPFSFSEDKKAVASLFEEESKRNQIHIYTDHENVRLAAILPENSKQCFFGFWETKNDFDLNYSAFQLLLEDARNMD